MLANAGHHGHDSGILCDPAPPEIVCEASQLSPIIGVQMLHGGRTPVLEEVAFGGDVGNRALLMAKR